MLKSRDGDHFGISMQTGRQLVSPTHSAIKDHIEVGRNMRAFKCK